MKRVLLLVGVVLALGASSAEAEPRFLLTHQDAVENVKQTGGSNVHCERLALRHFLCRATYLRVEEELEEVEPGVTVRVSYTETPVRRVADVGLRGVRFTDRND